MFKALRYKPEYGEFDSRLCNWNFVRAVTLGSSKSLYKQINTRYIYHLRVPIVWDFQPPGILKPYAGTAVPLTRSTLSQQKSLKHFHLYTKIEVTHLYCTNICIIPAFRCMIGSGNGGVERGCRIGKKQYVNCTGAECYRREWTETIFGHCLGLAIRQWWEQRKFPVIRPPLQSELDNKPLEQSWSITKFYWPHLSRAGFVSKK